MTTIEPISLWMVNCYLLTTDAGHVLVDTGVAPSRPLLLRRLAAAGCTRDTLRLVVLTHGDYDHTGNAAYLRRRWHVPIAAHPGDSGPVGQGATPLARLRQGTRKLAAAGLGPDVVLQDGDSLIPYGLNATVLHLPGHSPGSIAILTAQGDLICGDLLALRRATAVPFPLREDAAAMRSSIRRLLALPTPPRMIYPGHGKPFTWEMLREIQL